MDFFAVFLVVFFVDRLVVFLLGPLALRSASRSLARSMLTVMGSSTTRSVAFVSPSVTYAPNRPSRTTINRPDVGSGPTSRKGAATWPRPRRCLGWANSARACSKVTEKI